MNASLLGKRPLPHRRLWLSLSLCLGLISLLCASCILEPFSLLNAPCAGITNECVAPENCIKGVCRLGGTPECTANTDCACGQECAGASQVCFDAKCSSDDQCKRAGCDFHCDLANSKCVNGPPPAPFCKSDKTCNGQLCVDNRCKPCAKDNDCLTTNRCDVPSGKCIKCTSNAECAPQLCDNNTGRCIGCNDSKQCESQLCKDGACVKCEKDNDCATLRCDKASGKCQPCQQNSDCPTQLCASPFCIKCQNDDNCSGNGGNCSEEGVCTSKCTQNSDCGSNYCKNGECSLCTDDEDCPNKRCLVGRCAGPCNTTNELCPSGRECDAGICQRPGEGKTCAPPLNCRSPFLCVDEGNSKVCRNVCSPLSPSCPNSQKCQFLPNSDNPAGICVSPNNGKAVGESCDAQTMPCLTGLYCFKDSQGSMCRNLCSLQDVTVPCAGKEICVKINGTHEKIGACVVATCGANGAVCQGNEKCIEKQCKKTCTKDTDCSSSQHCYNSGQDQYCKEKECASANLFCAGDKYCDTFSCKALNDFPKTCTSVSDCSSGTEYCMDIPGKGDETTGNPKRCWKKCTSTPCATGYKCVFADLGTGSKVCLPIIGGSGLGAACSLTAACENDQICITESRSPNDSRCLPSCQPNGTNSCPSGFSCEPLGSPTSTFGVCINDGVSLSLNRPCGLHLGQCVSGTVCFSSSTLPDTKPYCRETCSFSCTRTSGYTCRTFTVRTGTVKVCLPP